MDDLPVFDINLYFQAHSTMHSGHPCSAYSSEEFKDGITNGAAWYIVSGKTTLLLNVFTTSTIKT